MFATYALVVYVLPSGTNQPATKEEYKMALMCDLNPANFLSDVEVAIRELEDEYTDGLISANAYQVRKTELQALLEEESN